MKHIDNTQLGKGELHGQKGRFRLQRRKSSKVLSDMKFLMEFIKRTLQARNAYRAEITIETVDAMYGSVSDLFRSNPRTGQLNWLTAVNTLRRKQRNVVAGAVARIPAEN